MRKEVSSEQKKEVRNASILWRDVKSILKSINNNEKKNPKKSETVLIWISVSLHNSEEQKNSNLKIWNLIKFLAFFFSIL